MTVSRPSSAHSLRAGTGYALLLLIIIPAQAQFPSTQPAAPATQRASAFLSESSEARQALEEAIALKEQGDMDRAVRACQRVFETYGDSLLEGHGGLYFPLAVKMNGILRDDDPAWVTAYRQAFSQQASLALQRLGDDPTPQELLAIAHRWWLTEAGGEATYRAAMNLYEAGQWRRAAGLLTDLGGIHWDDLDFAGHPDSSKHADWLFAQALILGQDPSAAAMLNKTTEKPFRQALELDQMIWWRGHRMGALDAWMTVQQFAPPAPAPPDRWPSWGGDASRNRRAILAGEPLELLWKAETSPAWGAGRDWRAPGDGIGGHVSLPVTDGTRLLIQDANRIRAIGLHHGLTLWEYALKPEGTGNADRPMGASTRGPLAPVIHEGYVYAALGNESDNPFTEQREHWDSYLTCLRADDGTVLWRISADTFARMAGHDVDATSQHTWWWFDGSPLVHERALFTVIRSQQSFGFEDCYLARWDPLTGQCVWWTHVASGHVGRGTAAVMTRCDPTAWEDDLYVQTNLGALANLSSMTGRLNWLRAVPLNAGTSLDARHVEWTRHPWALHPLRLAYGNRENGRRHHFPERLIAIDQRSRDLLDFDFLIGRLRSQISPETLGDPEAILGPHEGTVYAIGDDVVAFDLETEKERWRRNLLRPGESLDGMACLTDDALWIPTDRALAWISLQGQGPQRWSWEELGLDGQAAEQGGNLLALGNILLSVRRTHVAAWSCGTRAFPLLKIAARDAPQNPHAHLALARCHLVNAANWDDGWKALQRAIDLSDAKEFQPYGDVGHRRHFDRLVVQLMNEAIARPADDTAPPVAVLNQRFGQWSAVLGRLHIDPDTRNSSWITMARLMERRNAWPQAVHLWQKVVAATPPQEAFAEDTQRQQALSAQARILASHGREPFAEYDQHARRLFEVVTASDKVEPLEAIVDDYRYASTAPEAILALADHHSQHNNLQRAAETCLLAWHRYGPVHAPHWPAADTRELLSSLIRSAMHHGQYDRAAYWSFVGSQVCPDATLAFEGRTATFDQWHHILTTENVFTAAPLPAFAPPIKQQRTFSLTVVGEAVPPEWQPLAPIEPNMPAWWLIADDRQWQAYDPATGDFLWQRPRPQAIPPQRLFLFYDQAIVTSTWRWLSLDPRDGTTQWAWGQVPLTWNAPQVDPEIWGRLQDAAWNDLWIAGVWDDHTIELIRLRDGQPLWRRKTSARFRRPLAMGERFIAYASRAGDRTAIIVLDLFTGSEVATIHRPDDRLVHGLHFTTQGYLLAHGSDWLASYDPQSADTRWSQPLDPGARITRLDLAGRRLYLAMQNGSIQSRSVVSGGMQWSHAPDSELHGISDIKRHGQLLYIIRPNVIDILDIDDGQSRAYLLPPPSSTIHRAWLTQQGVAALIQSDTKPLQPGSFETAAGYSLALWKHAPSEAPPSGANRIESFMAIPLGQFTQIKNTCLIETHLTLESESALITWKTSSP